MSERNECSSHNDYKMSEVVVSLSGDSYVLPEKSAPWFNCDQNMLSIWNQWRASAGQCKCVVQRLA